MLLVVGHVPSHQIRLFTCYKILFSVALFAEWCLRRSLCNLSWNSNNWRNSSPSSLLAQISQRCRDSHSWVVSFFLANEAIKCLTLLFLLVPLPLPVSFSHFILSALIHGSVEELRAQFVSVRSRSLRCDSLPRPSSEKSVLILHAVSFWNHGNLWFNFRFSRWSRGSRN